MPYSADACRAAATKAGLELGGQGYSFEGAYSTKGCYYYKSGKYAGRAFYGTGGTQAQMEAAVTGVKYRPTGYNTCILDIHESPNFVEQPQLRESLRILKRGSDCSY